MNPIFSTISCDDVCRTSSRDLETAVHALCIGQKCILSGKQNFNSHNVMNHAIMTVEVLFTGNCATAYYR